MNTKIEQFNDEFRFLSNFWPSPFTHEGIFYETVEHFYQAQKTLDLTIRKRVAKSESAGLAKKAGRELEIRQDWESVKDKVMWTGLANKFVPGSNLAEMLLATEDAYLQEGNHWGDVYWGVDTKTGKGKNKLGKMLMKMRKLLKEKQEENNTGT